MVKKEKAKSKAKSADEEDDAIYEDGEEGEWVDEEEPEVTPQAVPAANLLRTTTVTEVNPTPPTNVEVVYQGSPPTPTGFIPQQAPAPDVDAADFFLFKDPLNGAATNVAVGPPTVPATTPSAQLAGKAEFSGLTSKVDAAHGRLTVRGVAAPAYSETPNASHPSYGT